MLGLPHSQSDQRSVSRAEVKSDQRRFLASSSEVRKVQKATILKNLEHRLQVAREQGNQQLINQLEAERRQFG